MNLLLQLHKKYSNILNCVCHTVMLTHGWTWLIEYCKASVNCHANGFATNQIPENGPEKELNIRLIIYSIRTVWKCHYWIECITSTHEINGLVNTYCTVIIIAHRILEPKQLHVFLNPILNGKTLQIALYNFHSVLSFVSFCACFFLIWF